MRNDTIIELEGLGKQYRVGAKREAYKTLRDTLMDAMISPLRRAGALLGGRASDMDEQESTFWALEDLSFRIKRGEVVGIVGANGAGKSTLLKILSRITEPTVGWGEIRGRVSSLLEVGTGFHNELSGRENIYLNGAILGMRKTEIERKFDDIVSFAEVEKFIDTPVKRYSTGMYLRLAFAVAAHLEPDILIVDEVLAVGDAGFQKKCLSKMHDVGRLGRTVLFVSHNMNAITRLCERAILLDKGRIVADGPSHAVVSRYLTSGLGTNRIREWDDPATAPGDEAVRLRAVRVRDGDGRISDTFDIRRPLHVEMEFDVLQPGHVLASSFDFIDEQGITAFIAIEQSATWRQRPRPPGRYCSSVAIPGNFLAEGTFFIDAFVFTPHPHAHHVALSEALAFHVIDPRAGDSVRGEIDVHLEGGVRPLLQWRVEYLRGSGAAAAERHGVEIGRPEA
jgi:lipopolysaccharide transport system ATP-binding protein